VILVASLNELRVVLGREDAERIERNARIAEAIEQRWKAKADDLFSAIIEKLLNDVERNGRPTTPTDLEELLGSFFLEHEVATVIASERTIEPAAFVNLAKTKRVEAWPNSIGKVHDLWNQWKRTGKLPNRTKKNAAKIRKVFIDRVQSFWRKHGADFIFGDSRKGYKTNPDAWDREGARQKLEDALRVATSHARMIIETETTRYYNDTRRAYYDHVESVVGYLFICVRDARTTEWCRSRGGVVFTKGTALLTRNTPPCHWNCRSELLPLSRFNPAHMKIFEDKKLRAENRKLAPLPVGWAPSAA